MVVIFCDLDDYNMLLRVLKDGSRIASHYIILLKRIQQD
jgi:hypothetical protein